MERTMRITIITFFVIMAFSCLGGCSRKTAVEHSFNDVQQAVDAVKETLPQECKTDVVLAKIGEIETKKQVAQSICKEKIKSVQIKYERSLFALILIISVFFLRFFIKR